MIQSQRDGLAGILSPGIDYLTMRTLLWLPLWLGICATQLTAGSIGFDVTPLAAPMFRYTYYPSGIGLQANQDIDIRFDPALYGNLTAGVAGSGFSLFLLQPNNPPGTSGDYSALALVNNPLFTGPFSVDFLFKGTGMPGSQPYTINQYDQAGALVSTIDSGSTVPVGQAAAVPEPASLPLAAAALVAGVWALRRRSNSTV